MLTLYNHGLRGFIFFCIVIKAMTGYSQESQRMLLSGTGSDNTVDWDFYCSAGRNSGKWARIPVPSCWELQGFGTYNYGLDPLTTRGKEYGIYRYNFIAPADWKGSVVEIIFEGAMTDTEVKINGKPAGSRHQGGFYEFRFDISSILNYGKQNVLETTVHKHSADESVNNAERRSDYWIFGGIFRPVYLESKPQVHINSISVDAKANGELNCGVVISGSKKTLELELKLYAMDGSLTGKSFRTQIPAGAGTAMLSGNFQNIKLWTPEFPNLYTVEVSLSGDGKIIHTFREKIGFRTVEVREHDGIYINGVKILFRGICRHSFWPESGRTTSKNISIDDVILMKSMNMNAVRMSHYPPDQHFLDACDSLGLFVLDELAGWQHSYDTDVGKKLVKEMVIRDVNHPSIVLWDNGNEGGWNTEMDDEFSKYDPQKREVIHPWQNFRKTDTHHYIDYNYGTFDFFNGDQVFFPTEFLHGLYDGGAGAGLDDYWDLMRNKPLSAGGFLWAFADESLVRTDQDGKLDSDGNHAPDGILGPHREKEASYYTIKEIWSPVYFEDRIITPEFDGSLFIENRYHFTNLDQCSFEYKLGSFEINKPVPEVKLFLSGKIDAPDLKPGQKGILKIELPDGWRNSDVMYITAKDPYQREIITWSRAISSPAKFVSGQMVKSSEVAASFQDIGESVILIGGEIRIEIEKSSGRLKNIQTNGKDISFLNGPVLTGGSADFVEGKIFSEGQNSVFEAIFNGNLQQIRWTMLGNGMIKLNVRYRPENKQPYYGINFSYPEKNVTGISWIGEGPYRVWKNRMKGTSFGLWQKKYNNTVTGQSFNYPEFKGYHSELYWMKLLNTEKEFIISTTTKHLFLRLFTPEEPAAGAGNAMMKFPQGNISFLQGIAPIGTKFELPEDLGPQSQLNLYNSHDPFLEIELYFDFR